MVYGGLLFLMMRFSPGGIAGMVHALRKPRQTATPNGAQP